MTIVNGATYGIVWPGLGVPDVWARLADGKVHKDASRKETTFLHYRQARVLAEIHIEPPDAQHTRAQVRRLVETKPRKVDSSRDEA